MYDIMCKYVYMYVYIYIYIYMYIYALCIYYFFMFHCRRQAVRLSPLAPCSQAS